MATEEPQQAKTEIKHFFSAYRTKHECLYLGVVTKNEKRRIIVLLTYPNKNLQKIRFSHYVDMKEVKPHDFTLNRTDEEYETEFWRSLECKRGSFDYKIGGKKDDCEYLYLIKKSQRGKTMVWAKIEILSPEQCDGTNYILSKLEPTIKFRNNVITTLRQNIITFTKESEESLVELRKLMEEEKIEEDDLIKRFILVLKEKNKRMKKLENKLQNLRCGGAKNSSHSNKIKNPEEILNEEEDDEKQAEVEDDDGEEENKIDFEQNVIHDLKIPSMQDIDEEIKKQSIADLIKSNVSHNISYGMLPTIPSMDPALDKVFDSFSGNFNDEFHLQRKRKQKRIIKRRFSETEPEQSSSQNAKKQKISAEDANNEDPNATLPPNICRKSSGSQSSDFDDLLDALD